MALIYFSLFLYCQIESSSYEGLLNLLSVVLNNLNVKVDYLPVRLLTVWTGRMIRTVGSNTKL